MEPVAGLLVGIEQPLGVTSSAAFAGSAAIVATAATAASIAARNEWFIDATPELKRMQPGSMLYVFSL